MRICLASVHAGGGHTTAMYSLAQSIRHVMPHAHIESFVSRTTALEYLHRLAYTTWPRVYDMLYVTTAQRPRLRRLSLGAMRPLVHAFYKEFISRLDLGDYDAVISTHFLQTFALLQAKYTRGLTTRIIAYVPDWDDSLMHVPCYKGLQVDAVIAQSASLVEQLATTAAFSADHLQHGGFLPRSAFSAIRAFSPVQARARVAALDLPLVAHLQPDAFTVVVTAGTHWSMGLYSLLTHLASCPTWAARPACGRPDKQILVVCGTNARAYKAYKSLRHATGLNILPLPFLPPESLAAVFRSADVTILGSVAPATIYELLEAQAGILLVHRRNPGPEHGNVTFVLDHGLAQYLPDMPALLRLLLTLSVSPQLRAQLQGKFLQDAARERLAARQRAHQTAEFIVRLACQTSPAWARSVP